jgi:hypothetical protein
MPTYDFYSEDEERLWLTQNLKERYPYRESLYDGMSTRQLWAMFLKPAPQSRRYGPKPIRPDDDDDVRIPHLGDPDYKPLFARFDGADHILADSGEYVEIDE